MYRKGVGGAGGLVNSFLGQHLNEVYNKLMRREHKKENKGAAEKRPEITLSLQSSIFLQPSYHDDSYTVQKQLFKVSREFYDSKKLLKKNKCSEVRWGHIQEGSR